MRPVFPAVVPMKDIFHFENSVGVALQVPELRLECFYDESLFTKESIPVAVEMMKRELPIINGFMNRAQYQIDGNQLQIDLYTGGHPILKNSNFRKNLRNMSGNISENKLKLPCTEETLHFL